MEKTLYFFGTQLDNELLLKFLKTQKVALIDPAPNEEKGATIINDFHSSKMSEVILLNTDLMPVKEYEARFKIISGYYHYQSTGRGIIQLLKPQKKGRNLKFGRLFANSDDSHTNKWVNTVFKWIKSNSKKVHRTTQNMRIIAESPEKNFYSLPDAGKEFSGKNGSFLTIGNGIYCITKS